MTIFCLGSINADHIYQVPHLPAPGETLAATGLKTGLGGKGANQSVAAAKAGAEVFHIGAVGADGAWTLKTLAEFGVNAGFVATVGVPTGHAIINVDTAAENAIVLFRGANYEQQKDQITKALEQAKAGDFLMLQNETSHQLFAAKLAAGIGMRVVYSAAPFDVERLQDVLPWVDILALNEVEAEQLSSATDTEIDKVDVSAVLMTRGSEGAVYYDNNAGTKTETRPFKVTAVDTTGAGDTFAGYVVAGLDRGLDAATAMRRASAAAALKVTRPGASPAIPYADEVEAFLNAQ